MKNNVNIACIIVSYNSYDDILDLLDSIENQQQKLEHIIIVDNCSPNWDGKKLEELSKKRSFNFIQSDKNWGFAYACNIGIREAEKLWATHIWLLNPDAILSDTNYFFTIKKALEEEVVDILGTFVVNKESQKIEFWWGKIGKLTLYPHILNRWVEYKDYKKQNTIIECDTVTGSSMYFPLSVMKKVWFLDESYFMYFEETDYCIRARKSWLKVGIIDTTYIDHNTSSSVGRMSWFYVEYMIRNFALFAMKNGKWYQLLGWIIVYIGFWIPGFLFRYLTR